MHCEKYQEQFLDYQDGTLAPDASATLRAHLASCPTCQREWSALQEISRKLDTLPTPEPSPRLRENFYAMLETHQHDADAPSPFAIARSRLDAFFAALLPARPALQFAFSLTLLASGLFVGSRYFVTPTAPAGNAVDKAELAALRAKVDSMGQLVTYSLLQQKSTSERLQTVLATMDLKSPDRKVLNDLVGTLAFDPSVNVRLSAVEALAAHADDRVVRAGLLAALPRENAPLVQLALIDLLSSVHETEATPLFERLSRDEAADKSVREAARRGLATLRTPPPADQPTASQTNPPTRLA